MSPVNKLILIVEDDKAIGTSLKELLEENNYDAILVTNGSEALNYLRTSKIPALLLLDLMMPIMDGFQFRQFQLADPALKDIPTIVMSADGHVVQKKIQTGANEYLKKPLDIYHLLQLVEKFAS